MPDQPEQHDGETRTPMIFGNNRESAMANAEEFTSRWTPEDEEAYLARVREKAAAMAKDILAQAEREAETVREAARQEGYKSGVAQADAELEQLRSSIGDMVQVVLSGIEAQSAKIYTAAKADLVEVTKLAVEKITGLVLNQERETVLENLFDEAMRILESHKSLTVTVNPEDEPAVADVIAAAKEKHPDLTSWQVKASPALEPGSVQLESESSMADNSIGSRRAAVAQALDTLILP